MIPLNSSTTLVGASDDSTSFSRIDHREHYKYKTLSCVCCWALFIREGAGEGNGGEEVTDG